MDLTHEAALFVLQVGVVLVAAKIGGELFERFRQPAVLGELLAGIVIGPYALGGIALPLVGHLFGEVRGVGEIPIPLALWVFAELGAVVLLFNAGLDTDFSSFVRFGPAAVIVAIGGVVLPFVFGDLATVALGLAPGPAAPEALFVGAALTATSVGVTARVLGDIGRLDTPEGVTILGAAVFDDVIGILVLALVVAIAQGGALDAAQIVGIGGKALGAYALLTLLLIVGARRFADAVNTFRSDGAALALALALGLVSGFIAESVGLAMIVGAFSAGIALSRSALRARLEHDVRAIAHFVVPVFFVVVGMLVDLPALSGVLGFGVIVTALAIAGKAIGCALPTLALGFRPIGALRIGIGMIPRGEVALIIAGIGLATRAVDQAVFGVVVFMTVATTIIAPMFLVPAFARGGRGFGPPRTAAGEPLKFDLEVPADLLDLFMRHLMTALRERGFIIVASSAEEHFYELRREGELMTVATRRQAPDGHRVHVESEEHIADWPTVIAGVISASRAELDRVLAPASPRRP